MFFKVEKKSDKFKPRLGKITTTHGEIETPIFMPVGTRASVKGIWQDQLHEMEAQIILGNTYHLYLRPGHDLVEKMGGLHQFMNWTKPILTDSGGFQVFSLSSMNKITEDGVHFQSHIDGSKHFISPEKSMEIQKSLGSDIVMCFDECPKLPATKEDLEKSVNLTLRWAQRCRDYNLQDHQFLFGIIQGGLHADLRTYCMEELIKMDFPGFALGGLSVGEKNQEMVDFCDEFVHTMPEDKPRYLMGVGKPMDILNAVKSGIDMFDCVLPTRNARNGQVFTKNGPLNIRNKKFQFDEGPLDPDCSCKVCSNYSRSYIRHLDNVGEYLAGSLLTYHNLAFYLNMMEEIRQSIREDRFLEYYDEFTKNFTGRSKDS